MDNLSGSPFGLYLTFYFWLLGGVRLILKFLRVSNKFLLSLVVVIAVIVENLIVIGTFALAGSDWQLPSDAFKNMALPIFWALFTGPIFLLGFLSLSRRFNIQPNGASP